MHKKKQIRLENGDPWTLQANISGLEELEELYKGAPAFAVLGDEDERTGRLPRLIFGLSATFRRRSGVNLSYTDFTDGDYMPEPASDRWKELSLEVNEFVAQAFPHAIRQGKALLMVARQAASLGLIELSPPSSENGTEGSGESAALATRNL